MRLKLNYWREIDYDHVRCLDESQSGYEIAWWKTWKSIRWWKTSFLLIYLLKFYINKEQFSVSVQQFNRKRAKNLTWIILQIVAWHCAMKYDCIGQNGNITLCCGNATTATSLPGHEAPLEREAEKEVRNDSEHHGLANAGEEGEPRHRPFDFGHRLHRQRTNAGKAAAYANTSKQKLNFWPGFCKC